VHPNIPGVPWWGAVLIAVTATAIGFAFDAGSGGKELTVFFSASYVIGCVAAVLAVRQSGVFTAVIQPPLILFVSVPGAYWLFHGAKFTGIKDTLINCGYPLIERFPLMVFTSAGMLLVGMVRWYLGTTRRAATAKASVDAASPAGTGRFADVTAKISTILMREPADEPDEDGTATEGPQRKHSIDRPARVAKTTGNTARTTRAGKRAQPSRSRHARPPETEIIEPVVEQPRRARPPRHAEPPPEPGPEPRRRRTRPREPGVRNQPPLREPGRRNPYERTERPDRQERPDRSERPGRRSRFDDFEPYEPPPPRKRPGTNGTNGGNGGNGGNGTHHPISRVRYRGAEDDDTRAAYRTRHRARHNREPETWEYDT